MSPVSSIIRIFLAGMEDKSLTYLENQISHNFVGILVLIGSGAASSGNRDLGAECQQVRKGCVEN